MRVDNVLGATLKISLIRESNTKFSGQSVAFWCRFWNNQRIRLVHVFQCTDSALWWLEDAPKFVSRWSSYFHVDCRHNYIFRYAVKNKLPRLIETHLRQINESPFARLPGLMDYLCVQILHKNNYWRISGKMVTGEVKDKRCVVWLWRRKGLKLRM